MLQSNFLVKAVQVSSDGNIEAKQQNKVNNNKFKDVFEHKRLDFKDKDKDFTRNEEKIKKPDNDEKPKAEGQIKKEVNQTKETLNKKDINRYKKKEDGKESRIDDKETKEMEIKKRLMELAKALGIDPEKAAQLVMPMDLKSIEDFQQKIETLVEKLAALSDVTEEEKPNLAENLKEIVEKLFTETNELKDNLNNQKKDVKNEVVEGVIITDKQDENNKGARIRESDTEGLKNTDGIQKSIEKPEGQKPSMSIKDNTKDEVKQTEAESAKTETKAVDKQQGVDEKDDAPENEVIKTDNEIEIKDDKKKADNQDEGRNKEQKNGDWTEKIKVMFKYQEKIENPFKIPVQNNIQTVQSLQDIQVEQKVQLKASSFVLPHKEEVLSQIIDKAAVTLTADKAEMVLNLKPDNLGKLEMKLVTEKGIMNAQIVAENQQVKQIIESNFNVLRDALEKQGIAVQSFSVSVGNNNLSRGFQNNGFKDQNTNNQRQYKTNGITVNNLTYLNDISSTNKIMWPESTVNYTA
ncbi:MAG: flagellar hook-length control protein FliK [Deltaproteobacteria bacterium]